MKFQIELPVKKGDTIYTIQNCKIEKWFVEKAFFEEIPGINTDESNNIYLEVDRYNDSTNSCRTNILLSECFLTKEELIKQL